MRVSATALLTAAVLALGSIAPAAAAPGDAASGDLGDASQEAPATESPQPETSESASESPAQPSAPADEDNDSAGPSESSRAAEPAPSEGRSDRSRQSADGLAESDAIAPQNVGSFPVCSAGYSYSVSSNGTVRQVTQGNVTEFGGGSQTNVNGLAIAANGSAMYAIDRGGNASQAQVLTYNHVTNKWETSGSRYSTGLNGSLIAGAVDLSTGKYLYGGFETAERTVLGRVWHWILPPFYGEWRIEQVTENQQRFRMWSFDPATNTHTSLGYFWTESSDNTGNGDMAFDAAGNLYVVRSSDNSLRIFTVEADDLAAANGGEIPGQAASSFNVPGTSAVNGIAFDADGTVLLGDSSRVTSFDPGTWASLGEVTSQGNRLSSSTDLASCNSPSTLTIKKNVVERQTDNDEFTLSVRASGSSAPISEVTTDGPATGMQNKQLGPVPAVAGNSYVFSETGAGPTNLDEYDISWTCTSGGTTLGSGEGPSGTVTIPVAGAGQPGAAVECIITNEAIPDTTLQLIKVVEHEDFAPAGTTGLDPEDWDLTATPQGGTADDALEFTSGDEPQEAAPGTYVIGENEIAGFELRSIVCQTDDGAPVELDLDGANAQSIEIEERTNTVCTLTNADLPGEAAWFKTDGVTGERLPGSVWNLAGPGSFSQNVTDYTGEAGYEGRDVNELLGEFAVEDLAWGEYTLTEVTPPEGYLPLEEPVTIVIGPQNLTPAAVQIDNELALVLSLEKYGYPEVGQADPSLIDGSQFAIFADEGGAPGAQVDGAVSAGTATGTFVITGLRPGTYWLQETAAPTGHNLLAQAVQFQVLLDEDNPTGFVAVDEDTAGGLVTADGSALTIKVYDERAVALPIAGGGGTSMYMAAGLLLTLLAAGWALGARLRSRRRSSTESAS